MAESVDLLGGTVLVWANQNLTTVVILNLGLTETIGTILGYRHRTGACVIIHDMRYYLIGFDNGDFVSDAKLKFLNNAYIEKRGTRNSGTIDLNRIENGGGVYAPRTSGVPFYISKRRVVLFLVELKSERMTRMMRSNTERLSKIFIHKSADKSINRIMKIFAFRKDFLFGLFEFIGIIDKLIRNNIEPATVQIGDVVWYGGLT